MLDESTPGFSLRDRTILLTGGAGLYGRGLTSQLAATGAVLILASRNIDALEAIAREERELGRTVYAKAFDQAEEESVHRLRDSVLSEFGHLDGLVNNAVARPMKHVDAPLADWDASMRTNATGLFAITRAIGDMMAARGTGSIVNIGSVQGMVGPDYSLYEGLNMEAIPDYFFHKAGMTNLTRYFAAHYGPRGVRVNCLSPGGFYSEQNPVFVERYARATFLRRMAGHHDLGGPVIFMLSEAARYITGVNLPIDGGYTAH